MKRIYDLGLDILGVGSKSGDEDITESAAESEVTALMRQATAAATEFTELPDPPQGDLIDNVLGFTFDWTDIFNPAGAGIRYYEESQQPHGAPGTGALTSGKAPAGKPSPAAAASLAASKARLAALQQQLAAARLRALHSSVATAASLSPPTPSMTASSSPAPASDEPVSEDATVMGFPSDELDDIILESYQHEITDEPPDYERRRASVHRGAAYLQDIDYPPHGASGGQEGGMIMPSNKIEIFGGHHYSRGLDVLGAKASSGARGVVKSLPGGAKSQVVPQRAGFVAKTTPAGRTHTSLAVNPHKAKDHKTSIANARTVGQRAISVGNKISQKLTAATKVHGAPAKAAAKPAISRLAAAQLKQMVDKTVKKGKAQLAAADKHEKFVNAATGKLQAGVQKVAAKLDPSGRTKIHGCVAEETHEVLGIFCEEILGASLPDPTNPGYLQDGTPDPNYGSTGAPPDPSRPGYLTDGTPDPNYSSSGAPASGVPGPPDYGLGPAPTTAPALQPGIDFTPDPVPSGQDRQRYSSTGGSGTAPLPNGAVIYDGSQPFPRLGVGSYHLFAGEAGGHGDGGGNSGFEWDDNAGWFFNWAGDDQRPNAQEGSSLQIMQKASIAHNWGPLIGNWGVVVPGRNPNPVVPWTKGLRYDEGGNQWFWFRDMAPSWATQADDLARLNQAILDYQTQFTAAQTDYVAQKAQDALDAQNAAALAKQQAAEDAQAARQMQQEQAQAQHQADLEAVQAQQQAKQQQLADEAAARQAQAQSQIDIQQAQAQAEIERQQMAAQAEADRQAMQTQADIEARAAETAAQLEAMQPPGEDEGVPADEGPTGDDEEGGWGSQAAMARAALSDDTDMMGYGRMSDSARLQRRRF